MDGALRTKTRSDFKCPIEKSLVETMSHYFLGTWGHKILFSFLSYSTKYRYESCLIENFLKGTMSLSC